MKYPPIVPIETERLILREFRMSDLENHYRHITSDPEVAKIMLWEANPDIAHAEKVLQKNIACYGTKNGYRWAIALKGNDAYIGTISLLRLDAQTKSCAFAYMLGCTRREPSPANTKKMAYPLTPSATGSPKKNGKITRISDQIRVIIIYSVPARSTTPRYLRG